MERNQHSTHRGRVWITALSGMLALGMTGAGFAKQSVCDQNYPAGTIDGPQAHGYCTAYCEAMKCDSEKPKGSAESCQKLLERFLEVTGQAPNCQAPARPPA